MDTGIPIPLDALMSPSLPGPSDPGRKRSREHDDSDQRGPPKGPRLSSESQFSRFPQLNGHSPPDSGNWNGGGMNGRMNGIGMGGMGVVGGSGIMNGGMNGHMGRGAPRGNYQQPIGRLGPPDVPRRGICRDYHSKSPLPAHYFCQALFIARRLLDKGYCARGAMCKYSHDDAAVAPGQLPFQAGLGAPMPIPGANAPFMPIFSNGGMPFAMGAGAQSPTYDPHEAHMDMRPGPSHGGRPPTMRVPMTSRAHDANGEDQRMRDVQGELPVIQDLTPRRTGEERAGMDPSRNTHGPQREEMMGSPMEVQSISTTGGDLGNEMDISGPVNGSTSSSAGGQAIGTTAAGMRPTVGGNPAFRGGMRGVRGRGGTFTGDHQAFRPDHLRDKKTLVVEKIPEEHLSLDAVNGWFKRFGSVTNVAIDRSGAKALVSFSSHDEAESAWRAEDAVFNNRFVKIFWHRPMEGQGATGARMLQASAPLVANMSVRDSQLPAVPSVPKTIVPKTPTIPTAMTISVKKAPSSNVSALAAKQQVLEKQIAEQKDLMTRLGTATVDERKEIMSRWRKLGEEMKSPSTTTTTTPIPAPFTVSKPVLAPREDKERKAKELLDMELDLHSKSTSQEGSSTNGKDEVEKHESLEEKLARLRAEVHHHFIACVSPSLPRLSLSG